MGVNNLLSIGNHALLANQTAINVVGSNIANVEVDGYSRQIAEFEAYAPYQTKAGAIGMGAHVAEITRAFDRLLENTYLDRFTEAGKFQTQEGILTSVESLFNESNREGINSLLSSFFNSWQKVANLPNDLASKQALLSESEELSAIIRESKATLENYQEELDKYIEEDVAKANELIDAIAQLNQAIGNNTLPKSDPNQLLDERDSLVRELAAIVDVTVEDMGGMDFTVRLSSGKTLVDGVNTYGLIVKNANTEYKVAGFTGEAIVSGEDDFEYYIEAIDGHQFRLSLDGGQSWVQAPDGSIQTYDIPPVGQTVKIKELELSFTADDFLPGDVISITPKTGVYYDSPTRIPENITPLINADGSEDPLRLTGGTLSAYFIVRDYNIGKYVDKLDAMAETLIWETNAIYSQGASTYEQSAFLGTQNVKDASLALADSGSGLYFNERLQEGNFTINVYDTATGDRINHGALDFDTTTPEIDNFDPNVHSLNDVVKAINDTFPGQVYADIVDGKIQIESANGTNIAFSQDSSGLLAGLGINTFYQGTDSTDISVRDDIRNNVGLINSGQVNQAGVITEGDNSIALEMATLSNKKLTISTPWETTEQSISGYYSSLVALVGADTSNASFNANYHGALSADLEAKTQAVSGVNLDEEMASLIKFQHSYTAAAKLITTADEMLQTVLGLKQ